jgi:sugar phosphate isomerase/epimerase
MPSLPRGTEEPTISVFCDEATPDPSRQIELMQELGIADVDLRSAWNTDVLDMDAGRVADLAKLFSGAGMRIVCLATRIGKKTPVQEIESVRKNLLRSYELAELFGSRTVRIFGFLATHDAPELSRVVDVLGELAESARRRGITLLLECERGLIVDGPEKALAALRAVNSPALRFIWDAGNMVDLGITSPTDRWFDALVPYLGHVHVKDGVLGSKNTCFAGAGDGQIGELVERLCARSYDGAFSLEPNVGRLAGFDGDREKAVRGAVQAFRALIPAPVSMESAR